MREREAATTADALFPTGWCLRQEGSHLLIPEHVKNIPSIQNIFEYILRKSLTKHAFMV